MNIADFNVDSLLRILGIDKVEKLISRFEQLPIKVKADLCMRQRFSGDKACQACANVCFSDAINLDKGLAVDIEACIGCDLCTTVCPVGALESTTTDDFLLARLKKIADSGDKVIFRCERARLDMDALEQRTITLSCLGRLNETVLISASVFGIKTVYVETSACDGCQITALPKVLDDLTRTAQSLLAVFDASVKVVRGLPEVESSPVCVDENDAVGLHSRRDFLGAVRRQALLGGAELISDRLERFSTEIKSAFAYHLPRRRELLLMLLRKMNRPATAVVSTDGIPFAQLDITDECTFCGNCALFCPSKALSKTAAGDAGSLDFAISCCTDCGLCFDICPVKAVRTKDTLEADLLLTYEPRKLIDFHIYTCRICQQQFGSSGLSDVCHFCRRRQNLLAGPGQTAFQLKP